MSIFIIESVIENIKSKRRIFHIEADFKFAMAWEIQSLYQSAEVRLECPILINNKTRYVDILVRHKGYLYPIELKYKTRKIFYTIDNETFKLKNH